MYNKSAVFIDRDGTINVDNGYICKINDFIFIDHVITALIKLKKMGFLLIIITNQSGIARGLFTKNQFILLTMWMIKYLQSCNAYIDAIYFCPHHKYGIIKEFKKYCFCRKPNPGMLLSAKKHFCINMSTSYMVGDNTTDMLAAQFAKVRTKVFICKNKSEKLIMSKENNKEIWKIPHLGYLPTIISKLHGITLE